MELLYYSGSDWFWAFIGTTDLDLKCRRGDGSLNSVLSPRVRLVLGFHLRISFEIWSSSLELILSKLSTLFNSQDFLTQNFFEVSQGLTRDELDGTTTRKNDLGFWISPKILGRFNRVKILSQIWAVQTIILTLEKQTFLIMNFRRRKCDC